MICWGFLIAIAKKTKRFGITICDISRTESKGRDEFSLLVSELLSSIERISPKIDKRIKKYIASIAKADVLHGMEYYFSRRILLIASESVESGDNERSNEIMGSIIDAATYGLLRKRGINPKKHKEKVERLLSRQREVLFFKRSGER